MEPTRRNPLPRTSLHLGRQLPINPHNAQQNRSAVRRAQQEKAALPLPPILELHVPGRGEERGDTEGDRTVAEAKID